MQHTVATEPKYCPPEMFSSAASGALEKSAAPDIYVLGFIFYEILAGRRLFRQQFTEMGKEPTAFEWMRWQADPQKELRPLTELLPSVPKALADLVRQMTDKDPRRRVTNLEEVRNRLQTISAGFVKTRDFRAPRPPGMSPVPKRKRSRAVPLAVVILTAAILGAAGWYGLPYLRAHFGADSRSASYPPRIETRTGAMLFISQMETAGKTAPFYIDEHEVTNWQYQLFCRSTGRPAASGSAGDAQFSGHPEYPVRGISRNDFQAYANWAGKRVPTAAEVEVSAPRFDRRRYPWQPATGGLGESPAPPDASPEERRAYILAGFRCVADANRALELRADVPAWQFWRKWTR